MRTYISTAVLLSLLVLLTGCWSRRELNDLAIVSAIGIDRAEDNKYVMTAQIIIPDAVASKAKGGVADPPVVTFSNKGLTLMEGFRRMLNELPRKLYFSHLRVLVISEQLAKEGIQDILDFFDRYYEFRRDFYIIVAKDVKAEQMVKVLTPIEKIPANMLFNTLEKSEQEWSPTSAVTLAKLLSGMVSTGQSAVLTGVRLIGNAEAGIEPKNLQKSQVDTRMKYGALGVIKKGKLAGWLKEDEARGYNYITDNVKRTARAIPCPEGGYLSVNVVRSQTKVKGYVRDGKPEIRIKAFLEQDIGEVACRIDLTKEESIQYIDNTVSRLLAQGIQLALHAAQSRFKADIFGFSEAIHRADPKAWKKLKPQWEEIFPALPVHVEVEARTRRTGTQSNSFIETIEKEQ